MFMTRRRTTVTALFLASGLIVSTAGAQTTYPQTIYWGAGLIDIPVAWVSPLSGDFAMSYSGKNFKRDPGLPKINYNDRLNSQLTFSVSVFGRVEGGVAFFSSNPEWGFFGQALLVNEEQFRASPGAARWIPSIAVGMRNVGPYEQIDRFGVGYSLFPPPPGDLTGNYRHEADSLHENFNTAQTVYGVVTKSFSLSDVVGSWPDVNLSFTVGYGNGLFSDDGDLGDLYSKHETGGLFGGIKIDAQPTPNVLLSLMAENNAWDYNIGGVVDYRGLRAGVYWTEVGGSGESTPTQPERVLYGYSKLAFSVGWQSNVFALLKGDFLRNRVAELERQREQLVAEIASRQQRIAALQLEINRYEAQNLLELEQRRAEAEAQLRAEREALQRLEDRLRRLEQQSPPPPPPTSRQPER
jgi:hypothetical protein